MEKKYNSIANTLVLWLNCIKPSMHGEYDTQHLNNAHPKWSPAERVSDPYARLIMQNYVYILMA